MADTVGMKDIRGENIAKAVDGYAKAKYVFKQLCTIQKSNDFKESYFQESKAALTGGTGAAIEGVPRLAVFPHGEPSWTKKTAFIKKHGMESRISWEDIRTNAIDVMARTIERVAEGITSSVDAEIWDILTENQTPVLINTIAITAGQEWNSATIANRDPIQNILDAKRQIAIDNYNPDSNGYLCVNPTDWANLLGNANIRNAGQFYTDSVTRNGTVGVILGLKVIVSNNVTADKAAVIVGKTAGTWKEVQGLTTETIRDPGIGVTVRSWEIGVCQLKNPEAVCLISNTSTA